MTDYNEVLQNPKVAFKSPELQSANIEQTPLGLPRLVSGGFALTACATTQTTGHRNKWAIRCFHKEAPDLQERYQHISDFLQKQTDNFFVKFQYEPESICVRGTWYPIVKMAWIEGDSLNEYIENNLNNPQHLRYLAEQFKLISKRLHELNMGHGDLQHGNILIGSNGEPILIDYDGMYVPTMSYKNSNEIGHINFQHPRRTGSFFNAQVDRFSLIILYVSLQALASDSQLWKKYHTGTNLIFSRKDYQDSNNSSLFSDLKNISQIDSLVSGLKNLCRCAVEDIPTLEDFLNPSITLPQQRNPSSSANITGSTSSPAIIQTPFKVFAAKDILKLVSQEGETITDSG
jgi:serine/threonine protein kinase